MVIGIIFYALFGWLVGVGINHAADFLPTRQTIWQRPTCFNCGTFRPLPAWSVILAQVSGHQTCPGCGQPRPTHIRSVVIELLTPVIFVFLLQRYGYTFDLFTTTLYSSILLLITVTDLEHRLIFNIVILPSILVALLISFVDPSMPWLVAAVGGGLGFILSYIAALASRGGLGGGDVTLSTFLGLILGFPHILLSLGFGVFLGGFTAFILLITRRVGLKTFIPYGPFLTITGWIMLIWGAEIWRYYFW